MSIFFLKKDKVFHLQSENMSYCLQIINGYPAHAYWGKRLRHGDHLASILTQQKKNFIDRLPQEYPQYGSGDFRSPAYQIEIADDGSRVSELIYTGYRLIDGKPPLEGLPAVYVEADDEAHTLELQLIDNYTKLEVYLYYTIFEKANVIARSVRFFNNGKKSLKLLRALSTTVDFHDSNYEAIYLAGAWGREAHMQRTPLKPGNLSIDSKRGVSSHQLNPFFALARPNADENHGDVFGFSFVYSGNFLAEAEVDPYNQTRVSMGLNPFNFYWNLAPGQTFHTPEVIMVYSSNGIGDMSRTFHTLYRERLTRGAYRDMERPILVNNWEGTYFDFNEEKLLEIAKVGKQVGLELFVLDDGWFGKRNDDTTSLGDWYVNKEKLPNGLDGLAKKINGMGMAFGLWVEPEMISPKSELYKNHPDWCIHVKGRRRTEFRHQLILDYSRKDVRDYIFNRLSAIFTNVPVSYIKWDMNRYMTEIGSEALLPEQQMELPHRYVLGLYELLERFTKKFPHILFENCSSGGGRFDPGMLFYMPQTWTSDDTDAIERLKIQYGTSVVYPTSAIGAHISVVPNHQVGRMTPLTTRGNVAMSGNFGYEMDLTKLTKEEIEIVKQQVELYKSIRSLVQQGDLYRLKSPFEGNEASWMFVSKDKNKAVVFYNRVLSKPNAAYQRILLSGLDSNKNYQVEESKEIYGGDLLMQAGYPIHLARKDFYSVCIKLQAVD
ncbi:alpha-galactosidase [Caldibacillus lycopersici]|uniref:Alpha-galactosidase n=1 Tax=Perspicuibacillus lycopersici TaxID=1325689 RepID=A0AAE3IVA5_9BACI|nr:alpha-galactosidase [Perspicuibacillus lycopersici]MCU9615112.1 alpha-galactosidase [Perspicuibacillus lycopersici]